MGGPKIRLFSFSLSLSVSGVFSWNCGHASAPWSTQISRLLFWGHCASSPGHRAGDQRNLTPLFCLRNHIARSLRQLLRFCNDFARSLPADFYDSAKCNTWHVRPVQLLPRAYHPCSKLCSSLSADGRYQTHFFPDVTLCTLHRCPTKLLVLTSPRTECFLSPASCVRHCVQMVSSLSIDGILLFLLWPLPPHSKSGSASSRLSPSLPSSPLFSTCHCSSTPGSSTTHLYTSQRGTGFGHVKYAVGHVADMSGHPPFTYMRHHTRPPDPTLSLCDMFFPSLNCSSTTLFSTTSPPMQHRRE